METDPVGHTDKRQHERTRRLCEHTPRNTATESKHREPRGRKERPLEPAHTSSPTTDPQNREKLLLLSAPPVCGGHPSSPGTLVFSRWCSADSGAMAGSWKGLGEDKGSWGSCLRSPRQLRA